jgi:hypothetical protein
MVRMKRGRRTRMKIRRTGKFEQGTEDKDWDVP